MNTDSLRRQNDDVGDGTLPRDLTTWGRGVVGVPKGDRPPTSHRHHSTRHVGDGTAHVGPPTSLVSFGGQYRPAEGVSTRDNSPKLGDVVDVTIGQPQRCRVTALNHDGTITVKPLGGDPVDAEWDDGFVDDVDEGFWKSV